MYYNPCTKFYGYSKNIQKKTLFWEYSFNEIDVFKHRSLVIGRILEYGEGEDIRWMLSAYDREDILKVIMDNRFLGKKSQNFWERYFDIDKKVCMNKRSTQTPGAFSKR